MAVWRRPGLLLAEQPWGTIKRDGLPSRLGAHWEGELYPPASYLPSRLRFYYHADITRDDARTMI
jgi:hypothetical protein